MTTKILALTDALGNLVRFRLMPGQRYDSVEVPPLIDGLTWTPPITPCWAALAALTARNAAAGGPDWRCFRPT